MKIEEAKQLFLDCTGFICQECNNRHRGCTDKDKNPEMIETVLEALEKQIPKEPISPLTFGSIGICPICSASQFNKRNYCYNCGQAFKWEVTP